MTSLEYYIEQIEQFIAALTDDIESGEGTSVTQTKLAVYREELEHLEEIEQEPCEDAIGRSDMLDAIGHGTTYTSEELQKIIKALPPVNPQAKTGHWIMPVQDDGMSDPIHYQVRCSKCGFDLDPQTWHMELHQYDADKYCPKCGIKMIEPQEGSEKG